MYKNLEEGHSLPYTATGEQPWQTAAQAFKPNTLKRYLPSGCSTKQISWGGARRHLPGTQNGFQFSFHKSPKLPSGHELNFLNSEKTLSLIEYNHQEQKIVHHLGETQNIKARGNKAQPHHTAKKECPTCRASFHSREICSGTIILDRQPRLIPRTDKSHFTSSR